MFCDACGKDMTMPNGKMSLVGIEIEVVMDETMMTLTTTRSTPLK